MIQYPKSDEIIVEVPNLEPRELVGFHEVAQRLFNGALVRGRVVAEGGVRGIEWDLEGAVRVSASAPDVRPAVDRILAQADDVERAAHELSERLRRHADPTRALRVPAELARRIGATATRDFIPYSEAEARPLRDAMMRLVAGVRNAVARDELVMHAGSVKVYGWGILRRTFLDSPRAEPQLQPGTVSLIHLPDERQPDRVVEVLEWRTGGSATRIELVRVDGVEAVVDGTTLSLDGPTSEGVWRFPEGTLAPGSRYQARAGGAWGQVYSEEVRIPASEAPVAVAVPLPPPTVAEVEPPPEWTKEPAVQEPLPTPEDDAPPPARPARRVPLWCWLLLLLLLLLLLGFLLWLLLPFGPSRAAWRHARVEEHLPRFTSDVDLLQTRPSDEGAELVGTPLPETVSVVDTAVDSTVIRVDRGTGQSSVATHWIESDGPPDWSQFGPGYWVLRDGRWIWLAPPDDIFFPPERWIDDVDVDVVGPPRRIIPRVAPWRTQERRIPVVEPVPVPATLQPREGGDSVTEAPEVGEPEVRAPEVRAPEVRAPEVRAPEVRAPEVRAPEVRAPEVRAPEVRAPEVRAPGVRVPEVREPEVRPPDFHVPEVRVPEVRVPEVRVPEVRVPEVRAPEVRVPPARVPPISEPVTPASEAPSPVDGIVADPVDEPVDAPSPSRDEFIPAGHADTTVPDASRGVSEEVRSEPVVPQAQRLLTEFVWTEYAGGLLQPERPDADRGWRAIVGFVVAGPIANAIPADLEAARRWARDAGLTVIDCTDPAAGAVRLLVAGVKPSGGESPAGLSSEPLSRRAELPSIAAECVVGLLAPVGVSRAGSFDVRALDASGQLLDGVPPGSTTRLSDGEGRILEVIRVPLRPELGEVTQKFAFNDRVLKVGPFTIRHVQASEAEGEVVR